MKSVMGIPAAEFSSRRETLLAHVERQNLRGIVLFDKDDIQYFAGFSFLATERPVAVVGNVEGELAAFVPDFEVARVREEASFDRVGSYHEYPGLKHPMNLLGTMLLDMGIAGSIGADSDG